ncbi:VOC family protein [Clostridium cellulovorans]|uniref:PhnB protein n=1 Tax=Clostridium cellulovorans (strain ATCC 35296 / DSM 3052 / OCM 3 / 743B) TaxID=573061 RepID=D9SQW3_CLOC7|nr:VOC family protein [Clostridium cellulovorans]ADL52319.1 PhnB protein [Clostridium cellulovorans 743B]
MKVRPYIYFYGECQRAVDLYSKAFKTEAKGIMRFGDIPSNPNMPPLPEEQKNWIIQATIQLGDNLIRLSDSFQKTNKEGSLVCISVEGNIDEIQHVFATLQEGGKILNPLAKTFFSPCYGSLIDMFGVQWELSADAQE